MQHEDHKPLVLIVDDTPINVQVLAEALRADYRIKVATSGQVALDIVDREGGKPDLILLDVMMVGMDGYEVCRRLKENLDTREIPVIFVTARNDVQDEEHGLTLGAVDYIAKPFRPAIVKARVRNHINLRQTAAALRERQAQINLFVDHAPASIAMFDMHLRYLAASQRWIKDFGLSGQEIIGRSHYEVFPDIPERWKEVLRRCLAGATERAEADLFERADGSRKWLRWEVRPWEKHAGMIGGILIFSEDITELSQQRMDLAEAKVQADAARVEAERANSAKSHFLAAVSHDLRQPLHAMDIYVRLIAARLPAESADLVDKMQQCSDSLSALLNDLLDLSKLDAGGVKPRVSVFRLSVFLNQLATIHAPSAEQKELIFRVARTRLFALTDSQLLRQLVANLVANAIRYTERGAVLIGVRRRAGKLWIEVWDTGIGIPADKCEEIFEPFRQLGNFARDQQHGTGLGLALVQSLAKVLGLQIRVSSRLGRGSLFAIEVPRGAYVASTGVAPRGIESERRLLRVALVEDQAFVRDAMVQGLMQMGHEVVAAAGIVDLLEKLEGSAPDIIVADYRLRGGSTGSDAIAMVRKYYGDHISAVVVTGETDPAVVRSIADSGLHVLRKPVQLDELETCLDELGTGSQSAAAQSLGGHGNVESRPQAFDLDR